MKNRLLIFILIICLAFPIFVSCDNNNEGTIKVTDQIGNEVTIKEYPTKIVSGYYISTSACLALGLKNNLVGIEIDNEKRPIYQKSASELTTYPNVGSAKNFDVEKCISLKPDLVILPKKAKDSKLALNEVGIPVIVVNPESQTLLEEMITLIGKITNTESKAQELISYYHDKIQFLESKTKTISYKPTIYMCSTSEYLRGASTSMYQNDIIELAGGINVIEDNSGNFVNVSYEQLLALNPDIIIVPTNATATSDPTYISNMLNDTIIEDVSAIKNNKVFVMPSGYESWDTPVPSGILGALWLLNKLHPNIYSDSDFKNDVNDFYKTFYSFNANF